MFRYLYFDTNNNFTNSVLRKEELPKPLVNCIQDDTSDINLTYHNNGAAINKLTIQATANKLNILGDSLDTCIISGLPSLCLATILGEGVVSKELITSGTLDLMFDSAGTYILELTALHYLPKEFIINVN